MKNLPSINCLVALLAVALFAAGCSDGTAKTPVAPSHEHSDHGHHHEAPRGGTLVVLGDHVGHFEAVLDAGTGTLSLYALDGHAEEPVRLTATTLTLEIAPESPGEAFSLELGAVANVLTGETVGDSSEFKVANPRLRGLEVFEGRIAPLSFRGVEIGPVQFDFPEGNE